MSGIRSTAPVGAQALKDLPTINNYFWEYGTVNIGGDSNRKPEHPNPAFASSPNQALTLHYSLDHLLGFHLATAYAPLTPQSPLFPGNKQTSSIKAVVETAKEQFVGWSKSFQRAVANGSIIRFFTGDAIAYCHTLQQANSTANSNSANLYSDSWTFQPLKLDAGDYDNPAQLAPVKFDIIDTSNLVDHLGALNILIAASPLLVDRVMSALYTEVLVQHESSVQDMVDNILCGHFGAVSVLLGLTSVESWTNATAVAGVEEGMFDSIMQSTKTMACNKSIQMRTRLRWKKLSPLSRQYLPVQGRITQLSTNLEIDARDMSRLLYSIYSGNVLSQKYQDFDVKHQDSRNGKVVEPVLQPGELCGTAQVR